MASEYAAPDTAVTPHRKKPPLPPSRFLTPREIGWDLRRSAAWVYERIHRGELDAVRVDGALRVRREVYEAWLSTITS